MKDALKLEFVTQSALSKWGTMLYRVATALELESHAFSLGELEDRSKNGKYAYKVRCYLNALCLFLRFSGELHAEASITAFPMQ